MGIFDMFKKKPQAAPRRRFFMILYVLIASVNFHLKRLYSGYSPSGR